MKNIKVITRNLASALCAFTLLAASNSLVAQTQVYQARNPDPWLDPFTADSIWNTPIGMGAVLVDVSSELKTLNFTNPDRESFLIPLASDPLRQTYQPEGFYLGSFHISNNFRPFSNSNKCVTLLQLDGHKLINFNIFDIDPVNAARYRGYRYPDSDLYADGRVGGHGGSGLSNLGGSIRVGELTENLTVDSTIQHALKLEINWNQLYKNTSGDTRNSKQTFRWPANRTDGGAIANSPGGYTGLISALREGSLLTVADSFTPTLLTPAGKKIFYAIKKYGVYIVDTYSPDQSYPPVAQFCIENQEAINFSNVFGHGFYARADSANPDQRNFYNDIAAIWNQLKVVDNNGVADKNAPSTGANLTPETIGGGGAPRVPYKASIFSGNYYLVNKSNDKLLTSASQPYATNSNGNYIVTYPAGGSTAYPATISQTWQIQPSDQPSSAGFFKLTNANTGKVLRESGQTYGTTTGNYVIGFPDDNNRTEWAIRLIEPGYYQLINRFSSKALDSSNEVYTYNNTTGLGNYVIDYAYDGRTAERWQIVFIQPTQVNP